MKDAMKREVIETDAEWLELRSLWKRMNKAKRAAVLAFIRAFI